MIRRRTRRRLGLTDAARANEPNRGRQADRPWKRSFPIRSDPNRRGIFVDRKRRTRASSRTGHTQQSTRVPASALETSSPTSSRVSVRSGLGLPHVSWKPCVLRGTCAPPASVLATVLDAAYDTFRWGRRTATPHETSRLVRPARRGPGMCPGQLARSSCLYYEKMGRVHGGCTPRTGQDAIFGERERLESVRSERQNPLSSTAWFYRGGFGGSPQPWSRNPVVSLTGSALVQAADD
jgi:hypothetical protein